MTGRTYVLVGLAVIAGWCAAIVASIGNVAAVIAAVCAFVWVVLTVSLIDRRS